MLVNTKIPWATPSSACFNSQDRSVANPETIWLRILRCGPFTMLRSLQRENISQGTNGAPSAPVIECTCFAGTYLAVLKRKVSFLSVYVLLHREPENSLKLKLVFENSHWLKELVG